MPKSAFGHATLATLATLTILAAGPNAAQARDTIHIVGSSTVFPFTQSVAEEYASITGDPAPVVEATGTGGGFKLFCSGLGSDTPDITGASRAIKPSEKELCEENGVNSVTELLIGYDGLSLANSRKARPLSLTPAQIYLALAAEVPVEGTLQPNPRQRWSQIAPNLPDTPITVFGPPATSGTRDAFVELAMHSGCETFPEVAQLDKERMREVCELLRSDGAFIEAGENDNLIVQRLVSDPQSVGIFGFSFLLENKDRVQGVAINGMAPSFDTVRARTYPLVRPLFIYVKNEHRDAIPGLDAFIGEYLDDAAIGENGYLLERGLVPLNEDARRAVRAEAEKRTPLQ